MPKYSFVVEAAITLNTDVEADSLAEAIAIAQQRMPQTLCNYCSRGDSECWNTSGELDCEPSNAKLVDVFVDGEEDEKALQEAKRDWE